MAKKRVPPGGTWVLLATRFGERLWTACAFTETGEPIASAVDVGREPAVRGAMGAALERARPVRVLADGDEAVLAELGVAVGPLGGEHEELVERFREEVSGADAAEHEAECLEALADRR